MKGRCRPVPMFAAAMIAVFLGVAAPRVPGQAPALAPSVDLGLPVAMFTPFVVDSGLAANAGESMALSWSTIVTIADAPSLRIVFDEIQLGPADKIVVTAGANGESQVLDNTQAANWGNTSAFFNGDTLTVDLFVAAGSSARVSLAGLIVGLPGVASTVENACGTDDRIAAQDARVVRLVETTTSTISLCSGFLISSDSCCISAAHCFVFLNPTVAEVNVPPSLPNGSIQHPPVADQFPIDASSLNLSLTGPGDDWSVFRLYPNSSGQFAAALHGHFQLSTGLPSVSDTLTIRGFGLDTGVTSEVLQEDQGPVTSVVGDSISYLIDTEGGSSGSPVIDPISGEVMGIHTNGGCATGGDNSGVSVLNVGLQAAIATICNVTPSIPVASFTPLASSGLTGTPIVFIDTSSGYPTSWNWDFDGDGVTDSLSPNPSATWLTPGTYTVSLTVGNSLGSDTAFSAPITIAPVIPAVAPYVQDFGAGLPTDGAWSFYRNNAAGRIVAGAQGADSPVSGAPALIFDSAIAYSFVTNEAILNVDLAATNGAILEYWYRETGDENHPEDGTFLSDGTTETLLQSHQGGPSTWTKFTIDLVQAAGAAGMTLGPDMKIIFRQRDNLPIGSDGVLIDDVSLIPTDIGQPNSLDAAFRVQGSVDVNGLPAALFQNGPFFLDMIPGTAFVFEFEAAAGTPFQLILGPLNRNSFPSFAGMLDISIVGWPTFADCQMILDGFNAPTLLDSWAVVPNSGHMIISGSIPTFFPPGVLGTFQSLFSTPNGLVLSAATEITLL